MNEQMLTPGVTPHHGHMPEIAILSDTADDVVLEQPVHMVSADV
jgi:hypothetical protein